MRGKAWGREGSFAGSGSWICEDEWVQVKSFLICMYVCNEKSKFEMETDLTRTVLL